MTNDAWMFTLLGVAFSGIGVLFALFFKMNNESTKGNRDLAERVAKLETAGDLLKLTWQLLEREVMKAMHSPTNHLGLDHLIDEYIEKHYDLAKEKWEKIHDICEKLLENPERIGDDKALALLGFALSTHKLAQYGVVRLKGVSKPAV